MQWIQDLSQSNIDNLNTDVKITDITGKKEGIS